MPNRNKQKGDRFEHSAVLTARELFPSAFRTRAGWDDDRGDIVLDKSYRVIAQVKDVAAKSWFAWLDDLDAQKLNARAAHGVLVIKRRGVSDAGESLAVMRYRDWLAMAYELPVLVPGGAT